MIDIIGNIKLDETKPERIKYLLACIESYRFISDIAGFYLNLEDPSPQLLGLVSERIRSLRFSKFILTSGKFENYGDIYCYLLKKDAKSEFVINFMEDQFMLMDDADKMVTILKTMTRTGAEICMAGFFQVEQLSAKAIQEYLQTPVGIVYENSMENYTDYQKYYVSRYYIGVNFITTKAFAIRFWDRDCGPRPHEYEISFYDKDWLHRMMVPNQELEVAVDDDHGAENSCLLKRQEPKWEKIISQINSDVINGHINLSFWDK